jgi:nucleoside-diphosphate-sugar epimerase/SAM-dependent methyltransferase
MALTIMTSNLTTFDFELKKGVYLVAGATGMIGSHSLRLLANQSGVKVLAVCNKRKKNIFADNIQYISADLSDEEECLKLASQADYILMFAGVKSHSAVIAKDPVYPVKKSLEIACNMFYAAYQSQVSKLVWLSSSTGYPVLESEILHENDMFDGNPPDPWHPVGWMTRYLEKQCETYSKKLPNPIDIIVLRPTMVYGEFDNFSFDQGNFITALIRRIVERDNPIEVWGDGTQTRDLIHASDVSLIALKCISTLSGYHVMNIGEGESYSINHILSLLLNLGNFKDANITYKTNKPQTAYQLSFSTNRARDLGLKPIVSLRSGLEMTLDWYKKNTQKSIGVNEFSKLFDIDPIEFSDQCSQLLNELNFSYSVCDIDESKKIIRDIDRKCNSCNFSISGKDREADWQKGWDENLNEFVASDFNLDSLQPKYFNKEARPFRFNGQYIESKSITFEQDFMTVIRKWIFTKYLYEYDNIYEFGCGTGQNLAFMASLFGDKKYFGLDWVISSQEIIDLMSKYHDLDIRGYRFDFFKPNLEVNILPNSGIFTLHALEQVGNKYKLFIDYLLEKKPKICVHIEPINELYDENSEFDNIALKFHLSRNYLNNYLSYLKQLELENLIKILKIKKVNFGSLYLDGYSIIVWEII